MIENEVAPSIAELWAVVQEQRTQIARLEAKLQNVASSSPATVRHEDTGRTVVSRANLLKVAVAGAASIAGATALSSQNPTSAFADTATDGEYNAHYFTALGPAPSSGNGQGIGVWAPGSGNFTVGVQGESATVNGVQGVTQSGGGVFGEALTSGSGIVGQAAQHAAIVGQSDGDVAIKGWSPGTGVLGVSANKDDSQLGDGYGVHGGSAGGAGVFGEAHGTGSGVVGYATQHTAVLGQSDGDVGIKGWSPGDGVTGVSANKDLTAFGSGRGVHGATGSGFGVYGEANGTGSGVGAFASSAIALVAHSEGAFAVKGYAAKGGVLGQATQDGHTLTDGYGVVGQSGTGDGVFGTSTSGYGGEFLGGKACVRLCPSSTTGAPKDSGHKVGELFLDKSGALFLCTTVSKTGKATWKKLS